MNLKILLPFKVFLDEKNISNIVLETSSGSFGLLPQRLDCVAALVPGIFTYKTATGEQHYLAVDSGIVVKAGSQVLVSVRNAIGGADLGKLGELVKKEFNNQDETQQQVRTITAKLESGFMYSFDKFRNE